MLLKNENVYLICPEKDNIKMSEKYSAVTSIKFTDAKFMIEKKIERNDVIKKLLEQHVAICIKEIQVRNIFILSANTKMVMLKNMNVIEHMQLNEYSMEREASILEIIKSIDEMSTEMSRELNTNRDDVKKMNGNIIKLLGEMTTLEKAIPTTGIATNYKCKINPDINNM